ncbi:MAG: hypothetical protein LC723_10570, partial [Actinobacteria bacterium]|nr:hypothetical protein [Actinomycetota bacterium]
MSPTRSTSIDLVRLVRRFESQVPQVARDITDRIWAEIPGYAALNEVSHRHEVEEAAARNVAAFVRALGEGKDLSKRDIDALGVVGEQRAQQAIPLEDVLRAFRMVGRVLWDHLAEQLTGPSGPPMEVAIELGGTLMKFTDQISSAVANRYSVTQRSLVRQQEAARREFLHDLLLGSYTSVDHMLERSRSFGYDLARPHIAVVVACDGSETDAAKTELELSRALDRLGERLKTAGQPMVDRRGGQAIGLLALAPGNSPKASVVAGLLSDELGDEYSIGVGGPYPSLEGCRRSYL